MGKKQYTEQFKKHLVSLVQQGRSPEQLSREYEPTAQTIRKWVREFNPTPPMSETDKDKRLKELEAEVAKLKEEREILKKATAWFAMETTSNPKKGTHS